MIKHVFLTICLMLSAMVFSSNLNAAYDPSKTVFRFQQKMAERGDKVSQFKLGLMYETGSGIEQNHEQAISWYNKAAKQSYRPAQNRLTYLEIHETGFREKHAPWLKQLKQDARFNEGEALFLLGQMYAEGTGVNKSLTRSLKLLRKATAANIPGADTETLRVERELKQLQAQYLSQQERKKINTAVIPAPIVAAKPVAHVASINKPIPAAKPVITHKASSKPAIKPVTSESQAANKVPTIKTASGYISSIKRNAPVTNTTASMPSVAISEDTHPMDMICSGSNIFSTGCR